MDFCIVITGEDREPDRFKESIKIYRKLLEEKFLSKVIYSTTKENPITIDEFPKGFALLKSDSEEIGMGNFWIQTHQLEVALNSLSSTQSIVLKTRPDVLIKAPFIMEIFKTIEEREVNCEKTGLSNKIWNPWFDLTKPFYIADECFAGKTSDLKRFINYKTKGYRSHFQGITHVRRSIEPFLEHFPVLTDYLSNKNNCLRSISGGNKKENCLKFLKKSEEYLTYLAAYYFILNKYFLIRSKPNTMEFRGWTNCKSTINPELGIEDNIKTIPFFISTFIIGYDNTFIKNVNNGYYKDKISQKIYKTIKHHESMLSK